MGSFQCNTGEHISRPRGPEATRLVICKVQYGRQRLSPREWQTAAGVGTKTGSQSLTPQTSSQHSLYLPDHAHSSPNIHYNSVQCKRGLYLRPETDGDWQIHQQITFNASGLQASTLLFGSCSPSPVELFLAVCWLHGRLHCPFHYW